MKLVSCTLPTRGRSEWARQAVDCFLHQTYPAKELVIIDDQDDPSFPNPADLPEGCQYLASPERMTIPRKRNELAKLCKGDLICHFDSDDWSAPDRLETLLVLMQTSLKAVCGFYSMFFVDEGSRQAWKYSWVPTYALGTSLLYEKSFWRNNPFNESKRTGSDSGFVDRAAALKELATIDVGDLMVARVHSNNSDRKRVERNQFYRPIDWNVLPPQFLDARR